VKHLILATAVAAVGSLAIIRMAKRSKRAALDRDFSLPQKIHVVPVPRIGGLAIFAGVVTAAVFMLYSLPAAQGGLGLLLLGCALPAFLAGLVHDFSDSLTPRGRLVATAVSALLAYYVLGAGITRTDLPVFDQIVSVAAGSLFLTVLAVAGIAHAVNIIDGLNGLASMCVAIMLTAVAYVAFEVGDPLIMTLALAGIGAILGFFLWNYPAGMIFLGDGGAYFLGFYVAELSILLLVRNEEVSPLFPLLVCIYPVFETLFSVYRRKVLRARPPHLPDGIHLHSLVYRRLVSWAIGDRSERALTRRNSAASPFLWALCSCSVVPAVLFWDDSGPLAIFLLLFGVTYVLLYWRIVRFRSPRWLRFLNTRKPKGR
jgi:UDP-N-acetylmuramyl pentapeptide phosphotransferase/UDP-N-acetylglucosamine-1-phosphate transferase